MFAFRLNIVFNRVIPQHIAQGKKMEAKHTATPFKTTTYKPGNRVRIWDKDESHIADIHGETVQEAEATAAFIVRACNAHDDLVKALKLTAAICAGDNCTKSGLIEALELARAALAKAGA